jgi:hypothetical protein
MPPNDSTILLRLHSQQIHFANTVLNAADCEESLSIQPFLNQTLAEQCHAFSISGCCSREKDQKRSANFVIADNVKSSAQPARRGGRIISEFRRDPIFHSRNAFLTSGPHLLRSSELNNLTDTT